MSLPDQVTSWLRAMVSVRRVEEYLAEDDVPNWVSSLTRATPDPPETGAVSLRDAVFAWPIATPKSAKKPASQPVEGSTNGSGSGAATPRRFTLGPCTLVLPKGQLTLVCGATGSGKTAFLTALLGGKPKSRGLRLGRAHERGRQKSTAFLAPSPSTRLRLRTLPSMPGSKPTRSGTTSPFRRRSMTTDTTPCWMPAPCVRTLQCWTTVTSLRLASGA